MRAAASAAWAGVAHSPLAQGMVGSIHAHGRKTASYARDVATRHQELGLEKKETQNTDVVSKKKATSSGSGELPVAADSEDAIRMREIRALFRKYKSSVAFVTVMQDMAPNLRSWILQDQH